VGNLFGIDPQSGELWPKKGADELAQISKKNFFRITVMIENFKIFLSKFKIIN